MPNPQPHSHLPNPNRRCLQGRLLSFLDLLAQHPQMADKLLLMDSDREAENDMHGKVDLHLAGALPPQERLALPLARLHKEWQQRVASRPPHRLWCHHRSH